MTGAEWMVTRFGDRPRRQDRPGIAYTLMAVVMLTGFIGYAFQGIGKFASVYITFGLPPETGGHRLCASSIFAITTLYVLLGGLYGVVVTNVIQTVILTVASILIAGVAYYADHARDAGRGAAGRTGRRWRPAGGWSDAGAAARRRTRATSCSVRW